MTDVVAVLFTDLVGSTELRSTLGDETADSLRRDLDRLVGDAASAWGGRVIKGLGDGTMVTFDGAADALSGAMAVQQGVDQLNRRRRSAVFVRVAVSAGDVVWEEGDCFGQPVIEAARLCAVAQGGQILVTDVVRMLARARENFDFRPRGSLSLKGIEEPVPTLELTWTPKAAGLPDGLNTPHDVTFVGRGSELSELEGGWSEAKEGMAQIALVSGEPGIGKTRLAREIAELAAGEGAMVLFGRCDEHVGIPYQPFTEALTAYLDHPPPGDLNALLGSSPVELTRLVPRLAAMVSGEIVTSDVETERLLLFESVASWLATLGALQPVLLVVDDLHWAAAPTVLMLRHLARSSNLGSVMIVATYRETDLDRRHPLATSLPDLRRSPGVRRVHLNGLSRESIGELLEDEAGTLIDQVHTETGGNAFFVGEVLRHLVAENAVDRVGARWVARDGPIRVSVPEGVREVVGQRLNHLSTEANEVLTVAAAIGDDFGVDVLGEASGVDDDALADALDEEEEAHIVTAGSTRPLRYRFVHTLVQETLYGEISPARALRLHARIAAALERITPEDVPGLAHHWLSASPAHVTKAVGYATEAAKRAEEALGDELAISYYRRALDALDMNSSDHQRLALPLLNSLGEVLARMGRLHDAADYLTEACGLARRTGDAESMAEAVMLMAGTWPGGAVVANAGSIVEEALEALPSRDSAARARLLCISATRLSDPSERLLVGQAGLSMAERLGDPRALALACQSYHDVLNQGGPATVHEALSFATRARAAAKAAADLGLIDMFNVGNTAFCFLFPSNVLGRVDIIREQTDWLRAFASTHHSTYHGAAAELALGTLALAEGQSVQVEEAVAKALSWSPTHPNMFANIGVFAFFLARTRGTLQEIEPGLAAMRSDPGTPTQYQPLLKAFWVLLESELAQSAARRDLHELVGSLHPDSDIGVVALAAESTLLLNDREVASALSTILEPWTGLMAVVQPAAWIAPVDLLLCELSMLRGDVEASRLHLMAADDLVGAIELDLAPMLSRIDRVRQRLDPAES